MSAFKLRAAAAEFQPSTAVVTKHTTSTPQPHKTTGSEQGEQQQQEAAGGDEGWAEEGYQDECEDEWECYDDEAGDSYGLPDDCWEQHTPAAAAGGRQTQQQEQQQLDADDAVALLHSCYPTHPPALLQQLLEACGGDVQQAARILNDMDFEQRRARIAAAAAAGPGPYSSRSSSSTRSSGPLSKKKQDFNYSLEQFPALGGGGHGGGSSGSAASQHTGGSSRSTNWAAVTSKPPAAAAAPAPAAAKPLQGQQQGSRKEGAGTHAILQRAPPSHDGGQKDGADAVPWVETGAAVSQAYAAARAEASDHARVRNQCFQQATLAFMAGDKALAKELSAKGKAAAEAMWAAHERASSQIYTQRNARLQSQAAGQGQVIDLHGLHVQEMMQTLPQQLAALAAQQHESVSVIVGVGKHSKGPTVGRMGQAVAALLKELGYGFKEPQPGLLRVKLR